MRLLLIYSEHLNVPVHMSIHFLHEQLEDMHSSLHPHDKIPCKTAELGIMTVNLEAVVL
jgi:hypothetical protein